MALTLDIVSFAVPFPPVYGGVIDVFYRIRELAKLGVKIHLHAFVYHDSQPSEKLTEYCESVHYYARERSVWHVRHDQPFIQVTRQSEELVKRLAGRSGPILYEGLHTCGAIADQRLKHRPAFIRMHNIEWEYYQGLSGSVPFGLWKWYYAQESRKLRKFEARSLEHASGVFAISETDAAYFRQLHENVIHLPPFHAYQRVTVLPGSGSFVLYQGDLRLRDNFDSAMHVARICSRLRIPCVIAGRKPKPGWIRKLRKFDNTTLYSDVTNDKMSELMHDAHIHVIESSINAGFKLKLLASLFTGRHVVARGELLESGLEKIVHPFYRLNELPDILRRLDSRAVTEGDIGRRKGVLLPRYDNGANASRLIKAVTDS